MNASFTCKISTIKMVRFIFLLKQAMPPAVLFLLRAEAPQLGPPVLSLGAGAEPWGRWCRCGGAAPGWMVLRECGAAPWLCECHAVSPPFRVWGNRAARPFWTALQRKNLRKGKARLFPWILRVLLEGQALEGRCFFQSFHCGNESLGELSTVSANRSLFIRNVWILKHSHFY